jgi:hypothetical protein
MTIILAPHGFDMGILGVNGKITILMGKLTILNGKTHYFYDHLAGWWLSHLPL